MPIIPVPDQIGAESSTDNCCICLEPLLVPSRDEPDQASYSLDDVELRCGHHYHWSCYAEYDRAGDRAKCPLCRRNVLDSEGRLMAGIQFEGGHKGYIDLGDELDEEKFYDEHPKLKRERAFLGLMAQMDFEDAEMLLRGGDGEEAVDVNCSYENDGSTALHMAAINDDIDGIQLLLRYGADKSLRTAKGLTPLDFAIEADADRAAALLRA